RQARRAHPRGAREGGRSQSGCRGGAAAGAVAGGGIARRSQSRFAPRGRLRATPFHCRSLPARARAAAAEPWERGSLTQRAQGSLAVIFVWRARVYSLARRAAGGGNFDPVFNGMFPPVDGSVGSASRPHPPAPPPPPPPIAL